MKRIQLLLIFFCCVISSVIWGQTYGYLGKKNFIDVTTVSHVPVLANLLYAVSNGDGLLGDWQFGTFNSGVHVSVGRAVGEHVSLSGEVGYDYMNYSLVDATTEYLKVHNRSLSVMPKIEFSKSNDVLPLGLSNQIGIGYYQLSNFIVLDGVQYPTLADKLNGITIMYALQMRTPITRFLFLNYGVRYTYSFTFGYDNIVYAIVPYYNYEMDFQKRYNIVSVNLGVSYVF